MKVCDLSGGLGQLAQALAHLKDQWQATESHWHDENRARFDEKFLRGLPEKFKLLFAAAQRLNDVVEKAALDLHDDHRE